MRKLTKKQLEAEEREYAATQDKLDAIDAKREAERNAANEEPFLPHPFVHVPGLSGPGQFPRFPDRDPVTGIRYENIDSDE